MKGCDLLLDGRKHPGSRRPSQATTQIGRLPAGEHLYKQYETPNPVFNVRPRPEPLATDIAFSDTPVVNSGGIRIAEIFYGIISHVTDVFGFKKEKQF